MRSSPDGKVRLPSFEEMMEMIAGATVAAERAEVSPDVATEPMADEPFLTEQAEEAVKDPAAELLAQAKAQCEALRSQAEEEARLILEQAQKEAAALAVKVREQEVAKARQELEAERQHLQEVLLGAAEALKEAQEELYTALEPLILDTALHMAESILKYELERNDEAFLAIVHNVLEQSSISGQLTLHLAPGRFDELTAKGGPLLEEMAKRGVELKRDPTMPETDCMVTNEMGSTRGGMAAQLSRIRYAVRNQQLEAQE